MPNYTPEFEQYWQGITPTFEKSEANKAMQFDQFNVMGAPNAEKKSSTSMLSTDGAIETVNDINKFVDDTYGMSNEEKLKQAFQKSGMTAEQFAFSRDSLTNVPYDSAQALKILQGGQNKTDTFGVPWENSIENPNRQTQSGKAFFANPAGQEAEYTQEQLNDPAIQKFLQDNNYVLTKSDGVNYSAGSNLTSEYNQAADQVKSLTEDFLSYNVDQDPAFQAQATIIGDKFRKLSAQMEKTNYARQRAFETLGMRSGTTQYAGAIQMGIEGEELSQANERMAEITRQEQETLASARLAYEEGKYLKYSRQVDALKDIRDEKSKQLENYNKTIADTINNLREQEKFDFEVYKWTEEQKASSKPIVVAPGSSIYDLDTGEFIGTAPKPADDKAPEIQKWGGRVHQWNPTTSKWEDIGNESQYGDENNQTIIDWANSISTGKAKFSDVPDEIKSQVNSALANLPPKREDIDKIQTKITDLTDLKTAKGITGAVGEYGVGRFTPFTVDKAAKADFIATIDQLVGQTALDALIKAKSEGATFGALSNAELELLKVSATKFNKWARDKDGNSPASSKFDGVVHHYEISEELFKKEIDRVIKDYQDIINEQGSQESTIGNVTQAVDDYYLKNPNKRKYIDQLDREKNPTTGQPYTDEEKAQILGIPFNEVGSDTNTATLKKVVSLPVGIKGGQCGRYVNEITGLGVGDSYASKMAKMDKSIKVPQPGMVFTMPYSSTGHTGFILSISNGIATVKDSNYSLDEKVKIHKIPVSKMTGFKQVNLA